MYQVEFEITTNSSGDYTSSLVTAPQSDVSRHGCGPLLLYAVEWIDGDLEDGVDATLSMTDTLSGVDKTLLTLTDANNDAWYYPQTPTHTNAGAATSPVYFVPQVVEGTLKLVVASGGNAKSGKMIVYLLKA